MSLLNFPLRKKFRRKKTFKCSTLALNCLLPVSPFFFSRCYKLRMNFKQKTFLLYNFPSVISFRAVDSQICFVASSCFNFFFIFFFSLVSILHCALCIPTKHCDYVYLNGGWRTMLKINRNKRVKEKFL